jgi:hypothetical protein
MYTLTDFDGTICKEVSKKRINSYLFFERWFPFIKCFLGKIGDRKDFEDCIILTNTKNKIGLYLWLVVRGIKVKGIIFSEDTEEKKVIREKLKFEYYDRNKQVQNRVNGIE